MHFFTKFRMHGKHQSTLCGFDHRQGDEVRHGLFVELRGGGYEEGRGRVGVFCGVFFLQEGEGPLEGGVEGEICEL
jgi:hypothetical protein